MTILEVLNPFEEHDRGPATQWLKDVRSTLQAGGAGKATEMLATEGMTTRDLRNLLTIVEELRLQEMRAVIMELIEGLD